MRHLVLILGLSLTPELFGTPGNLALGDRFRAPARLFHAERENPAVERFLSARHDGFNALREETGVDWWARWDEDSRIPRVALAAAAPVSDRDLDDVSLVALARGLLERRIDLWRVSNEQLEPSRVRRVRGLRLVQFRQGLGRVLVRGAFVNVVFFRRPGALVLMRVDAEVLPDLDVEVSPTLTPRDATERARAWVGSNRVDRVTEPVLEIVPERRDDGRGVVPRLAYSIRVDARDPHSRYQILVDARDGRVLAAYDTICFADLTGTVSGWTSPGLAPDLPANPEELRPLEGLSVEIPGVGSAVTDTDGQFTIPHDGSAPVTASLELRGPFVDVEEALGMDLVVDVTLTPGASEDIVFASSLDELEIAQVNAFIHVNRVHAFLEELDPTRAALDFPIECRVNLATTTCNAFYDGAVNFVLAGGGCVNSAYSTVVYHEYGHAILDHLYGFEPGAYHEGMADTCSALLTVNPTIGLGWEGGTGFLRNIDLQDRVYPDDVTAEAHEAGLILSGAFWDTLVALEGTVGPDEALSLTRRYFFDHMMFLTGEISPLLTVDVLTIDDDDGNLLNGTPHHEEIDAGFSAHGLDAPALVHVTFAHEPLGDRTSEAVPYEVLASVETTGTATIDSVELAYSNDGLSYQLVSMEPTAVAHQYAGAIPAQESPASVRYYLVASDSEGHVATHPREAPDDVFGFLVGTTTDIYFEPVGATAGGWFHWQVQTQDDWQRGVPNFQGDNPWDPHVAYSPPNVWGNDLNFFGWDGDYPDDVINFIELPSIDCTGRTGVHLRYRRWLTVERAEFDAARVWVNDALVWQNGSDLDHLDTEWVEVTHDISALADDQPDVRVRFGLESDVFRTFGGWNLDDVRLIELGAIAGAPFVRGDCNTDARHDVADPIYLLTAFFFGGDLPDCDDACDVTDDGVLGLADALHSLTVLFTDAPPPSPPYPGCDDDPTPDALACGVTACD